MRTHTFEKNTGAETTTTTSVTQKKTNKKKNCVGVQTLAVESLDSPLSKAAGGQRGRPSGCGSDQ